MLRKPYKRYRRLHVYNLDRIDLAEPDDPALIGVWIEDDTSIFFFHEERRELIEALCADGGAKIIYQAELDYKDWEAGVEITSFATRFLHVRPVWEEPPPPDPEREQLVLDPSVIFGSGFHATTRLCLETLELLMLRSGERIRSVLDLGTGTGLLAIAAARMGAERVVALDYNPLAVAVARNNVELNGCADRVEVLRHDLQQGLPEMGFDLVITNLYKRLLLKLFAEERFWQPAFHLVSGFIPGMEADLLAGLPVDRVRMLHRANREQWRLWLLGKKTSDSSLSEDGNNG